MSVERQSMQADIVCVGFGPATAGFLHVLSKAVMDENGQTVIESPSMPGMPLQVLCYERADDISFGVSGIVTSARAIKENLSEEELSLIPMSAPIKKEELLWLMDPHGVSRRNPILKIKEQIGLSLGGVIGIKDYTFKMPFNPPFLNKHGGRVLSMGQFMQYMGSRLMSTGFIQIWPASPVSKALIEDNKVTGVRLMDQGVDKNGKPDTGYMPGMDLLAPLTVVGDGPVGAVGAQLNAHFGMPAGNHHREWAGGMKAVVELKENSGLEPGTVIHTMGYPEPEIFGFMYVLPDNKISLGIFIPTWFKNPVRNAYRYFQHWLLHPGIHKYLKDGAMSSWGAKSLQEDGLNGAPLLAGDGFARIGEGSGSTNILTNSGVDEAWKSGTLLAEGVVKLLKENKPFTKENLEAAYVEPRKKSWLHTEGLKAAGSRGGFQKGFIPGMIGMGLAGFTGGRIKFNGIIERPHVNPPSPEEYFKEKISIEEIENIRKTCAAAGSHMYDAVMDKWGWPKIEYDGKLLFSHQDALLLGGKVQAPAGYADHVTFSEKDTCKSCRIKRCIDMCSGQAIVPGEDGMPLFDREKCIHCGLCLWNCTKASKEDPEKSALSFKAGTGGLHSAEN